MFDAESIRGLTPITALLGAVLGLIGTGLGIANLWLSRKSHRVAATIRVAKGSSWRVHNELNAMDVELEERKLRVQVTNHSYFPVEVSGVGLLVRRSRFSRQERISLPFEIEGERRIESRGTSVFVVNASCMTTGGRSRLFAAATECPPVSGMVIGTFVTLATGQMFHGDREGTIDVMRDLEEWTPRHLARLEEVRLAEEERRAKSLKLGKQFSSRFLGLPPATDEPPSDAS